ncbi:MAG: hypothetical protein JW994_01810 [Candidatus Omnitrophica bacterium]|nr:hypothetical protein [Candidatus Omnitrophota bacterium]
MKKRKKSIKIRKKWVINPKTRIKKSEKIYSRKKSKNLISKKIIESI